MRVNDIQGTEVGSKTAGNFHSKSRKDCRNTNSLRDIDGTEVGSFKKSI